MSVPSIEEMPKVNVEEYIGDGVYVTHDGFHLWLRIGDDEHTQMQRIAMEPSVFQALVEYAEHFGSYFTGKEK